MKKGLAAALAIATLSTTAFISQPANAAGENLNAWRHCGLGAAVFPDNGTAAAISNIIWDLGTTALTSATVSKDTCNSQLVETARFIDENYEQLEAELAIGEGRHVDTMLVMLGVDESERGKVLTELRGSLVIDKTRSNSEKAQTLFYSAQNLLNS
ncbi:DUF3015 family protein [Idiomarina aminovorans]|uniref:DUF3015 family protein n=1 Tax=Idiomarina aminovorans TaxID=2914829 RepID=UPI00200644DD|nr:DUF3015 family protein [Idiomarina sp. ATCH4]MCK7459567.1 DUF3015 domain-containing protein [Idiomarina sp. ATCH4]